MECCCNFRGIGIHYIQIYDHRIEHLVISQLFEPCQTTCYFIVSSVLEYLHQSVR